MPQGKAQAIPGGPLPKSRSQSRMMEGKGRDFSGFGLPVHRQEKVAQPSDSRRETTRGWIRKETWAFHHGQG